MEKSQKINDFYLIYHGKNLTEGEVWTFYTHGSSHHAMEIFTGSRESYGWLEGQMIDHLPCCWSRTYPIPLPKLQISNSKSPKTGMLVL